MNKIAATFIALGLALGLSLVSCSDEPEVSLSPDAYVNGTEIVRQEVKPSFFTDYQNGKLSGSFKLEASITYYRADRTEGRWEMPDLAFAASQGNNISRTRIYISEGRIWELSQNLFRNFIYSNPFDVALGQINEKLGTDYKVLIGRPVKFDAETTTMTVKHENYDVLAAGKGRLTLAEKTTLPRDNPDIVFSEWLDINCYQWTDEAIDLTRDNLMKFASNAEAFDWLIDMYVKNFDVTDEYEKFASLNTFANPDNPDTVYAWLLHERALYSRFDVE